MTRYTCSSVVICGALLGAAVVAAVGQTRSDHDPLSSADAPCAFDDTGQLIRPMDYRTWVFVGSPLTPNDMNDGHAAFPEFHHVYIDPASYEHYKQTGEFRDGTVLVKELVGVGSKAAPSGRGYFNGDFLGVEAMVKSKDRFPATPSNWGFFRFTDEEAAASGRLGNLRRAAPDVAASCVACHASGDQDRVFTQFYPVLRAARNAKHNPENN